jgi:hypothetical protein
MAQSQLRNLSLNKTQYHFFLKKNRPRNTIAQELSDGRYQQRVVKSKKIYDRKKFQNTSRSSKREMSDV